jgi:hypothetical protein
LRLEGQALAGPIKLLRLHPCKTGVAMPKKPGDDKPRIIRENILLQIHNNPVDHLLLFSTALKSSISNNHHNSSNSHQDIVDSRSPMKPQVGQCRLRM